MSTPESQVETSVSAIHAALSETTDNGRARRAALAHGRDSERRPTSLVAYESAGRVLVIGPEKRALEAAEKLKDKLPCTVLTSGAADMAAPDVGGAHGKEEIRRIQARIASVHGHLGAFGVKAWVDEEEVDLAPSLITAHKPFDIVLDLSDEPWIRSEVAPPG